MCIRDSNDNCFGHKMQLSDGGFNERCRTTATGQLARNDIICNNDDDYNDNNDARLVDVCRRNHVTVDVLPEMADDVQDATPTSVGSCDAVSPSQRHLTSNSRSSKMVTWGSDLGMPPVDVVNPRRMVVHDDNELVGRRPKSPELSPPVKPVRRHTSPGDVMTRKIQQNTSTTAAVRGPPTSATAKRRATRVLGVMFAVFVVLWTPFFVLNLLSASCPQCVQSVAPGVWTVLVWLGWTSSLANPIIYTSFSPAFRAAFKRLLTCRGRRGLSPAKHRQLLWTSQLRSRHLSLSTN